MVDGVELSTRMKIINKSKAGVGLKHTKNSDLNSCQHVSTICFPPLTTADDHNKISWKCACYSTNTDINILHWINVPGSKTASF